MSLTNGLIVLGLSVSVAAISISSRTGRLGPHSTSNVASLPSPRSGHVSQIEPRITSLRVGMTFEETEKALWNGPTPIFMELDTGTGGNTSWTTYNGVAGGALHLEYKMDAVGVPRLREWEVIRP
jgi:hypothetical protein